MTMQILGIPCLNPLRMKCSMTLSRPLNAGPKTMKFPFGGKPPPARSSSREIPVLIVDGIFFKVIRLSLDLDLDLGFGVGDGFD